MKCNLVVEARELIIREFSTIEDEGLIHLCAKRDNILLGHESEEDALIIVIKATTLESLLRFASVYDIPVKIIY